MYIAVGLANVYFVALQMAAYIAHVREHMRNTLFGQRNTFFLFFGTVSFTFKQYDFHREEKCNIRRWHYCSGNYV
jgi:hypothetical protein